MSDNRNLTLRTLDVLEVLCGYAATGATNSELAAAAKTTPPNITKVMAQLIAKGWARKSEENGRFFRRPRSPASLSASPPTWTASKAGWTTSAAPLPALERPPFNPRNQAEP